MDEHATLVPASADRVIGVMNQKIDTDASGKAVLRGDLMNESGTTVNIPHVIARPGSRRPADYQHSAADVSPLLFAALRHRRHWLLSTRRVSSLKKHAGQVFAGHVQNQMLAQSWRLLTLRSTRRHTSQALQPSVIEKRSKLYRIPCIRMPAGCMLFLWIH